MYLNRLEDNKTQIVAERKELEQYFDKQVRQILKDEIPKLIEDLGKKEWLTKQDLIKLTGWSGRTIQHMRDTNQIPYSQHGRKILYPREGIMEFLEKHLIRPKVDV